MLQTGEPWPLEPGRRLLRTSLVAEALVERGWNVTWWLSAFEHQRKRWMVEGATERLGEKPLTYRVLRGVGYKKNVSIRRYIDHRMVASKFRAAAAAMPRPQIIVASLPCHRLAREGVRWAYAEGIPAVLDIRDPWPDTFMDFAGSNPLIRRMVAATLGGEVRASEEASRKASALIAVSEGYLEWGLDKARRARSQFDRVFPLAYPRPSHVEPGNLPPEVAPRLTPRTKVLTFVGSFGRSYRLDVVLKAARRLHEHGVEDLLFVFAGGGELDSSFRSAAASIPNVVFTGWIDAKAIAALLERSYIGLLPCASTPHTIPNKALEYLSAALPIASSLEGEFVTWIQGNALGFSYHPEDDAALYVGLLRLLSNAAEHKAQSANAKAFFERVGDARLIYGAYAAHLERIAGCE